MKTLYDFKNDVLDHFKSPHMISYCPICYGAPAILNSHRCDEGWKLYFDNDLPYETRVKAAQDRLKQVFYKPIYMSLDLK